MTNTGELTREIFSILYERERERREREREERNYLKEMLLNEECNT